MIDQQVKRIPSKNNNKKNKLKGISLVQAKARLEPNATFRWIAYFVFIRRRLSNFCHDIMK